MREHPQQQRLERLAGAEEADVGRRRRRQQAAQRVERFRANHRFVDAVGIRRRLRVSRAEMRLHFRDPACVGLERVVERANERLAKRRSIELGGHVIFPTAVRPIDVRNVARRLLEVRHQASPLQHFREDVRDAFARDVCAAELCDRVVSVLAEHACVEFVRARGADRARARQRLP